MPRLGALFSLLSLLSVGFAAPSKREISLQKRGTYDLAFSGSGTDPGDTDASIQGWGYLTFTRLDTYDLGACETWCDGIPPCAFINLFYEYNSDATYNPQFKCVAYAVPHTAAEKTNWGGQQLLPPPAGLSYIQASVGYTSQTFANPPTPGGFNFVFGPTDTANQADGLLESHSLSFYDTQGCANLCNAIGDTCVYFNIWLGVENGTPSYVCAMYSIPTDASTATNSGQDGLEVTNSRGYARIPADLISDGDFEDYNSCSFCQTVTNGPWFGGQYTFVQNAHPFAHSGNAVAYLTSPDTNPRTFTYTPALATTPGQLYQITFWHMPQGYGSGAPYSQFLVEWNGQVILTLTGGYSSYSQRSVCATAVGNDHLVFAGGYQSSTVTSYSYLDDVSVLPVQSC